MATKDWKKLSGIRWKNKYNHDVLRLVHNKRNGYDNWMVTKNHIPGRNVPRKSLAIKIAKAYMVKN